ncbi:MAG: RnfABCDGE type electron transport complex subunit G [Candidatus Omnitrophica bacterium]|nr:RnfABCDGE type electron transport complex subunit G [Candidatus Omnitrophota bacterium]MBL7151971.1 RnfABCDGE type electron transport complex subunit G [Candidatus Omnitrophota bacterium]
MKEITRYGLTLAVICLLASTVLALVNGFTAPQIKLQKEKEEQAALKEVMPQAAAFKAKTQDGKVLYYKAYDHADKLAGFIVKCEGKGYSSAIESLAGLDLKLNITDVKILAQNETPGLGTRITGREFLAQFKGKSPAGLGGVDAITGSTISSRAVIDSIKKRTSELEGQLSQEIENAG